MIKKWAIAFVLGILLTGMIQPGAQTVSAAGTTPDAKTYEQQEARFRELLQLVMEKHVDKNLDVMKLTDAALHGMMDATGDPHSMYFTDSEFQEFMSNVEGSFAGIGIYVEQKGDRFIIQSVMEGAPAQRAGLMTGDEVIAIDGESIAGKKIDEVTEKMKGNAGTSISMTVKRKSETLTVNLTREEITFSPVESRMLDNQIGYIQLYTFADNSAQLMAQHLANLQKKGMKGLILDLRDDPGGHLEAAVDIAKLFIDKGPVVHTVDRDGKKETLTVDGPEWKTPIAILVNGGTASASEILTAALQDYGLATVIGTKTYGKGTVQEIMPLETGGVVKLTVAEYFSPKMRKVNGNGITPDIVIESPDQQLLKAVAQVKGSTALKLFNNGTSEIGGFPLEEGVLAKQINGTWYVALRGIAEMYGGSVGWDEKKHQVTFAYGKTKKGYAIAHNPSLRTDNGRSFLSIER
ncbi:S41 family peptidase [Aneurinibacillus tyrosinisolvens]|uniref:S41 family peptidase n=1 Tax=Aneurinibacillus tyrosinisolvens TaxID=1443435 RepID=UPI00069966BF|nr:S41 family peptidase [Aneurinibacillus tyrosinisolvens]